MVSEWNVSTITCYFHREFVTIPYAARRSTACITMHCIQYQRRHNVYGWTWANQQGISPPVDRGSLANHCARVSIGRFEQLLQLVVLKRGDPRALLDLYFLMFSEFMGRFFSNQLSSCIITYTISSLIISSLLSRKIIKLLKRHLTH